MRQEESDLAARIAGLIDRETGRTTASRLAEVAQLSTQTIYNARDGKHQKPETLEQIRRAVEAIENGEVEAVPPRAGAEVERGSARRNSVHVPVGRGVWLLIEDGADPAVLARVLASVDRQARDR